MKTYLHVLGKYEQKWLIAGKSVLAISAGRTQAKENQCAQPEVTVVLRMFPYWPTVDGPLGVMMTRLS